MEDAVEAHWAALKERTRKRVPLQSSDCSHGRAMAALGISGPYTVSFLCVRYGVLGKRFPGAPPLERLMSWAAPDAPSAASAVPAAGE